MQNLFMLIIPILLSFNAISGTQPILEMKTIGLVSPEASDWFKKITIYDDGKVYSSYQSNSASTIKSILLATLPSSIIENISSILSGLEEGELSFPESLEECGASANTYYSGLGKSGNLVNFAQYIGCGQVGILNDFGYAYILKNILDGFSILDYIAEGEGN